MQYLWHVCVPEGRDGQIYSSKLMSCDIVDLSVPCMHVHGSVMVCPTYSMTVSKRIFYGYFPWLSVPLLSYRYVYMNKCKCFTLYSLTSPSLCD
jgi:hypothetical protein